ncbi:Sulfate transp domain containing protein, partial [Asbolus verrucosus]
FVIEFFSYPVIAGFACAASVQVSSAQINNLFGIPAKSKTFLGSWQQFFEKIGEISKWDTVLGIFSLLFLIAFREIKRFETTTFRPNWSRMRNSFGIFIFGLSIARNATIVIIGTVIAYSYRESAPLKATGSIKGGFPPFEPPPFTTTFNGTTYTFAQMAKQLDASIFLIPLVTIVQIVSIVKTFCKHGYHQNVTFLINLFQLLENR